MQNFYDKLRRNHVQIVLVMFLLRWLYLLAAGRASLTELSYRGLFALGLGIVVAPLYLGWGGYMVTRLIWRWVPLTYLLLVVVGWLTLLGSGLAGFEFANFTYDWLYR